MSMSGKPPVATKTTRTVGQPSIANSRVKKTSRDSVDPAELRRSSSLRVYYNVEEESSDSARPKSKSGKTATESLTSSTDFASNNDQERPSSRSSSATNENFVALGTVKQSSASFSANESRRVALLRSQIIQLERQLLIQQTALSTRAASFLELDAALTSISETCKRQLASDSSSSTVAVSRSDLTRTISELETLRRTFSKQGDLALSTQKELPIDGSLFPDFAVERYVNQSAARSKNSSSPKRKGGPASPSKGSTAFSVPHSDANSKKSVNFFDLYSNPAAALNLRNVAELEERLRELYESCSRLRAQTQRMAGYKPTRSRSSSNFGDTDEFDTAVSSLSEQLSTCCDELFALSLLVPSCAWKRTRNFADVFSPGSSEEAIDERIRRYLTGLRNPQQKSQAEALLGILSHAVEMQRRRVRALEAAVNDANASANANASQRTDKNEKLSAAQRAELCSRVRELSDAFEHLREAPTQTELRQFVALFEHHFEDATFTKLEDALC